MSDPFNKVKPGDSLNIPAAAYNAFVDAARAHRDGQLGKSSAAVRSTRDNGIVHVKNCTPFAMSRFAAVGFREGTDSTTYDPPFMHVSRRDSFNWR